MACTRMEWDRHLHKSCVLCNKMVYYIIYLIEKMAFLNRLNEYFILKIVVLWHCTLENGVDLCVSS